MSDTKETAASVPVLPSKFRIHHASTGEVLVPELVYSRAALAELPSVNAQGQFTANDIPELSSLGSVTVYAQEI